VEKTANVRGVNDKLRSHVQPNLKKKENVHSLKGPPQKDKPGWGRNRIDTAENVHERHRKKHPQQVKKTRILRRYRGKSERNVPTYQAVTILGRTPEELTIAKRSMRGRSKGRHFLRRARQRKCRGQEGKNSPKRGKQGNKDAGEVGGKSASVALNRCNIPGRRNRR